MDGVRRGGGLHREVMVIFVYCAVKYVSRFPLHVSDTHRDSPTELVRGRNHRRHMHGNCRTKGAHRQGKIVLKHELMLNCGGLLIA